MSAIKHIITLAVTGDEAVDEKMTFALTEKNNVLICLWRDEKVVFDGTVHHDDWRKIVETFGIGGARCGGAI